MSCDRRPERGRKAYIPAVMSTKARLLLEEASVKFMSIVIKSSCVVPIDNKFVPRERHAKPSKMTA